jgi:hypothetical protein
MSISSSATPELTSSNLSSLSALHSSLPSPSTMSDLQRSFLKAKLAHLPPLPPEDVVEVPPEVDYDDSSSSASSASSTGTIKPQQSRNLFARPNGFVENQYHLEKLNTCRNYTWPLLSCYSVAQWDSVYFFFCARQVYQLAILSCLGADFGSCVAVARHRGKGVNSNGFPGVRTSLRSFTYRTTP